MSIDVHVHVERVVISLAKSSQLRSRHEQLVYMYMYMCVWASLTSSYGQYSILVLHHTIGLVGTNIYNIVNS